MQRIMIIGQPGSGKSTLARELGTYTGLPVIHIDKIHWQPGWKERSAAEKTRLCHEVEAGERWIFEGGHSATWDNRRARADLLIWLDRPLALRLWRVLLRTLSSHGRSRPDLPQDCPEQWGKLLELYRFMWTTRGSARAKMKQLVATAPPTCRVVCLRSDRQIGRFLSRIRQQHAVQPSRNAQAPTTPTQD